MKTEKNSRYQVFMAVDFPDDLINTAFDHKKLRKLFALYRSWGINRIYWIYTLRHGDLFDQYIDDIRYGGNIAKTYRNLGEFLPAAVRTAHDLGMEIYAMFKPNDLAFNYCLPSSDKLAEKHGKLPALGGCIAWADRNLKLLQHLRVKRRTDDIPDNLDRKTIAKIVLTSDSPAPLRFGKNDLAIRVSDDNAAYRDYSGDFDFREFTENGRRIAVLDKLDIREKYFSLMTPFRDKSLDASYLNFLSVQGMVRDGTMQSPLATLVTMYDEDGRELPFTYGLVSYRDHSKLVNFNPAPDGYIFNWDNNAVHDGFLHRTAYAVDNCRGYIAFAKGKEPYVTGILSPASREVRNYWLGGIRDCLDAGVDGIDIRHDSHSRNLEMENYGFDEPVLREFKRRYGQHSGYDREKLQGISAGFYTKFLREAAAIIRKAGRKVQIHIGDTGLFSAGSMTADPVGSFCFGRSWQWRQWIKEGLMDSITLKGMAAWDQPSYTAVHQLTSPRNIPVYFCTYMKGLVVSRDGPERFRETLDMSREWGQDGIIIYESAMIVKMSESGSIRCYSPEIIELIKETACDPVSI